MNGGRRGSAALIILLIIAILVVAGGAWYYTRKPTTVSPASSYPIVVSTTPTAGPATSAEWHSYSDVADGITFQYPPIVNAPTPSSTEVVAGDQTRVWFYGGGQPSRPQPPLLLLTVTPSATGTLESFEAIDEQSQPSADFQSITVDGQNAVIFTAINLDPNEINTSLFFYHDQKQYSIQLLTATSSSISPQGVLSQIANSVQFDH